MTRPVYLGGLGFGFKWNMGWMHDTLDYMSQDPIYRQYHHNQMTFSMMYAYSENFILPLSHDEVVHGKGSLIGKMPGDEWRKFAGLRTLLAYMWAHPGKQLLFMGSEFGQVSEWSADNGLDWWVLDYRVHQGVQRLSRDLNRIYRQTPALWQLDTSPDGFSWIDANDALGNTLSFLRCAARPVRGPDAGADASGVLACIANFSALPHVEYRIGLPRAGRWREVLNTDAERLRRQRRRQHGRRRGRAGALARRAGLGRHHRAAARRPLAHSRVIAWPAGRAGRPPRPAQRPAPSSARRPGDRHPQRGRGRLPGLDVGKRWPSDPRAASCRG